MFLGVDVGTSSVKAVLTEGDVVAGEASAPLTVSRPEPLWSEQDPDDWVRAAEAAVLALPASLRSGVSALGLSGQMHGATVLSDADAPLRPAILWNDGRGHREARDLGERTPSLGALTGNPVLPGFTAPKLAWMRRHEPDLFVRTRKVLLPKDYLRLAWTGDHATDVSDASGTLWLDVAERHWSPEALDATGLSTAHMPAVFEGTTMTGTLRAEVASRLGLPRCQVAAGGGDQAAGAVGAGVARAGEASLALGTSGVLFVVTDGFRPNPAEAVHAFCHALPGRWHQMAVILSAASATGWAARTLGYADAGEGFAAAEAVGGSGGVRFLPYLSGERTPHDDPHARGAWFGLGAETVRGQMMHAALEGVAFAMRDGLEALVEAGAGPSEASVIGGGARSAYWGSMLAAVLGMRLHYRAGDTVGPALGAARLARMAHTGEGPDDVARPGAVRRTVEPSPELADRILARLPRWRALYRATRDLGAET